MFARFSLDAGFATVELVTLALAAMVALAVREQPVEKWNEAPDQRILKRPSI